MEAFLKYHAIAILSLLVLFWALAVFTFINEKSYTALKRSFPGLVLLIILGFLVINEYLPIVNGIIVVLFYLSFLLLVLPLKTPKNLTDTVPAKKFDERQTMFSRAELEPDSERFRRYYINNPLHYELDDQFRKLPGLLSAQSLYYNKEAFDQAKENFKNVKKLYPFINNAPETKKEPIDTTVISNKLKEFAIKEGALDVGFTRTYNYHFYSVRGRGNYYDTEVTNNHKYAIALTVEMDYERVMQAPQASIVLESSEQYLRSGQIAIKLAETIRDLGYEARAHIDGDYELICPLVARDAGLGEIGRMGLLMTPKQGPRVRIAVLTTNMQLPTNTYKKNNALLDFCNMCSKCAECCPSKAIPNIAPKLIKGVRRWQISSEACYTYWCKAGTDCGRCMAVCPYSHKDSLFHNLIRYGIKHSRAFRWLAVAGDDYFYGRKPKPVAPNVT